MTNDLNLPQTSTRCIYLVNTPRKAFKGSFSSLWRLTLVLVRISTNIFHPSGNRWWLQGWGINSYFNYFSLEVRLLMNLQPSGPMIELRQVLDFRSSLLFCSVLWSVNLLRAIFLEKGSFSKISFWITFHPPKNNFF